MTPDWLIPPGDPAVGDDVADVPLMARWRPRRAPTGVRHHGAAASRSITSLLDPSPTTATRCSLTTVISGSSRAQRQLDLRAGRVRLAGSDATDLRLGIAKLSGTVPTTVSGTRQSLRTIGERPTPLCIDTTTTSTCSRSDAMPAPSRPGCPGRRRCGSWACRGLPPSARVAVGPRAGLVRPNRRPGASTSPTPCDITRETPSTRRNCCPVSWNWQRTCPGGLCRGPACRLDVA